jgi:hypothetical protein
MAVENNRIENPALLSKSELQWLLGTTTPSKTFEYKMLSNIRRKIQFLMDIDLPLLMKYKLITLELGRDLEPLTTSSGPVKSTRALVRQRSRVQIPAKASLFLQKEKEMNSYNSPESLLKTVSCLPNIASSHSQARVINIELKRSVDIEQIQTLHDDIEAATDKLTWIDTACKKKYEELSEICAQIRTLEKYIERFKKGHDYQELEAMVKNKVGEFLMCSLL